MSLYRPMLSGAVESVIDDLLLSALAVAGLTNLVLFVEGVLFPVFSVVAIAPVVTVFPGVPELTVIPVFPVVFEFPVMFVVPVPSLWLVVSVSFCNLFKVLPSCGVVWFELSIFSNPFSAVEDM